MRVHPKRLTICLFAFLSACGGGAAPSAPVAVDPGRSTLVASKAQAIADDVDTVFLTATARDAAGSPLVGRVVVFEWTGADSPPASPPPTTAVDGTATFGVRSTALGRLEVSVRIDGVAVAQHAAVDFVAGPPAVVSFTTQPSSATAGAAIGLSVLVQDGHGHPVGQLPVTLSLQGGAAGAALAGTTTAVALGSGAATFSGLSIAKAGTGYAIVADAGGARATSAAFDVTVGAPSTGSGGTSTTASPPGPVEAGSTGAQVTVTVTDAGGNPLPGVVVTFSTTGGTLSSTTATTDAGGHATVTISSTGAGQVTVTATVGGQPVGQPVQVTFQPGPAAALLVASQPLSGVAGAALGEFLVVARDAGGNATALPGEVTAALGSCPVGTTLSGLPLATGTTSASLTGLSLQRAGLCTLLVSSGPLSVESAPVAISAAAPSLTASTLSVAPASITAGGPAATATTTVVDEFGNPVPNAPVDATSSTPGDVIGAGASTSAAGVAHVSVAGTSAGPRTISAAVGGLPLVQTAALSVASGAPSVARSTISGPPGSTVADGAATATVRVTLRDAHANPVPAAAIAWSATGGAVGAGAGATGLDGTAAVTVTSTTAGGVAVTAAFPGGLLQVVVAFTAGPAASLELSGLPSGLTAGVAAAFTVTARDARGNVATGYRGTIHLASSDPSATLPADVTFGAGEAGQRSLQVVFRTAGARAITGTDVADATVTGGASATVAAGPAASLTLGGSSSPWIAGTARSATVTALDAFGNVATSYRGTVAFTSTDPAASLPGSRSFGAADAGAVALAGAFTLRTAGSWSITASDTADAALTGSWAGLAVSAAAPVALAFDVQPSAVTAGALLSPPPSVSVRDAFGNRAPSPVTVALSIDGGATLLGPTSAAAALGSASFAGLSVLEAGAAYHLTASAPGLSHATSLPFAVAAGAPSPAGSTLLASPGTAPDDGTPIALALSVGDLYGNPIEGAVAVFSASGVATFEQPATPTSASGLAAGAVSALVAGAQAVSALVAGATVAQTDVTFTPAPASADVSFIQVSPGALPADGISTAAARVAVRDRLGRTVPGAMVVLAYSGTATISPSTPVPASVDLVLFAVNSTTPGTGLLTATIDPGTPRQVVVSRQEPLTFEAPRFRVGGQVSGLTGAGLVLATPGLPDLAVSGGATSFAFAAPLASGERYDVTVKAQPAGQSCAASLGSGPVRMGDVTHVAIHCGVRWRQVAVGSGWALGVTTDGQLYAWGNNAFGRLGDGTTDPSPTPKFIGSGFESIAAGTAHALAVKSNGDLMAWGANFNGQVGDGTSVDAYSPQLIGTGFKAVAAGDLHSVALANNGDLYAWGDGSLGQIVVPALIRTPVKLMSGVTAIAAGLYHTMALKGAGDLWAWGYNSNGQVGVPANGVQWSPVLVGIGFKAMAGGYTHSIGVKIDGTLLGWGSGQRGQNGMGPSRTDTSVPTAIGAGFSSVSAGFEKSFAISEAGELFAWGANGSGALGVGWADDLLAPTSVGPGSASVGAGWSSTAAIDAGGGLWTWGMDASGLEVGQGLRLTPVRVGFDFVSISGSQHALGIRTNGDLYGWGWNGSGQVGGNLSTVVSPTFLAAGIRLASAGGEHSLAIDAQGTLLAWGSNWYGQLGTGTAASSNSPTPVGSNYAEAAAGSAHSLAVSVAGTLYAWGANFAGEVGDGTLSRRNTPVAIGSGFARVATGSMHSLAVARNGDLYAWGSNGQGELGDGTTQPQLAPKRIAGGFSKVAAGGSLSLGVTVDGDLYLWGYSPVGPAGSSLAVKTPTLVLQGIQSAWTDGACVFALDGAGQLLTWGNNSIGQLASGTLTGRSTPGTAGAGFVSGSGTLAITAAGQLFAWGAQDFGRLGDGRSATGPVRIRVPAGPDNLNYSSPVLAATRSAPLTTAPTWTGQVTTFTVSPALPPGLSLAPSTGAISGTPTVVQAAKGYDVTGTGPSGATTVRLTIAVN